MALVVLVRCWCCGDETASDVCGGGWCGRIVSVGGCVMGMVWYWWCIAVGSRWSWWWRGGDSGAVGLRSGEVLW